MRFNDATPMQGRRRRHELAPICDAGVGKAARHLVDLGRVRVDVAQGALEHATLLKTDKRRAEARVVGELPGERCGTLERRNKRRIP